MPPVDQNDSSDQKDDESADQNDEILISIDEVIEEHNVVEDEAVAAKSFSKTSEDEPFAERPEQFWWDDDQKTFSYRYNEKEAYIMTRNIFDLPCAVMGPLMSITDQNRLDKLSEEDRIKLLYQMALGTAMVGRHIHDENQTIKRFLAVKERGNKKLRHTKDTLRKSLAVVEKRLKLEKEKEKEREEVIAINQRFIEENKKMLGEINELKYSLAARKIECDDLRNEGIHFRGEVKELKDSLAASNVKIQELEMKLIAQAVPTIMPATTMEDATKAYKESEDYQADMGELGRVVFDLLRKNLYKDSRLDKTIVNAEKE